MTLTSSRQIVAQVFGRFKTGIRMSAVILRLAPRGVSNYMSLGLRSEIVNASEIIALWSVQVGPNVITRSLLTLSPPTVQKFQHHVLVDLILIYYKYFGLKNCDSRPKAQRPSKRGYDTE